MFGNPCFWPQNPCFHLKNRVFWPKNRKLFPNLFPNYFRKIFVNSKRPDISKKFPNFDNQTIPKLAKTKSLENYNFRWALGKLIKMKPDGKSNNTSVQGQATYIRYFTLKIWRLLSKHFLAKNVPANFSWVLKLCSISLRVYFLPKTVITAQ